MADHFLLLLHSHSPPARSPTHPSSGSLARNRSSAQVGLEEVLVVAAGAAGVGILRRVGSNFEILELLLLVRVEHGAGELEEVLGDDWLGTVEVDVFLQFGLGGLGGQCVQTRPRLHR